MIRWHPIDPMLKDTPVAPKSKPWRVTRYRTHRCWGHRTGLVYGALLRWYWLANAASFRWHLLFGWNGNTRRRIER